MTRERQRTPGAAERQPAGRGPVRSQGSQGNQAQGSIFSKQDREAAPAGERSGEGG